MKSIVNPVLVESAFRELYPAKEFRLNSRIIFSGKVKDYGALASYNGHLNLMEFKLNKKWQEISDDIKIGLVQELMLRLFKDKSKKKTLSMELYDKFVKNLHVAIPKTRIDPILKESFSRVNEKYFLGLIEMPNLVFGNDSTTVLGHYDYKTDTLTVSSIFEEHPELMDYIVYHELLHKKFKFKNSGSRNLYHSKAFKDEEKKFENFEDVERKINRLVRMKRSKSGWLSNFGF